MSACAALVLCVWAPSFHIFLLNLWSIYCTLLFPLSVAPLSTWLFTTILVREKKNVYGYRNIFFFWRLLLSNKIVLWEKQKIHCFHYNSTIFTNSYTSSVHCWMLHLVTSWLRMILPSAVDSGDLADVVNSMPDHWFYHVRRQYHTWSASD